MKYILASASPRRRELLKQAGFEFEVIPSDAEEVSSGVSPEDIVTQLALLKAENVFLKCLEKKKLKDEDFTVIGADTLVVYGKEILGKPEDEEEAYDMLSMLSDRTHQVYTGVALCSYVSGEKKVSSFAESTDVTFYPVDADDLRSYAQSGDPLDKAGSYGIQGPFAIHVKCIRGDYNNVVGLPIARLYQELKKTPCTSRYRRLTFE